MGAWAEGDMDAFATLEGDGGEVLVEKGLVCEQTPILEKPLDETLVGITDAGF